MKKRRKIYIIIVATILNIFLSVLSTSFLVLTENQILYCYSTLAQVTAALFGLTLAVYSIADSKVKSLGENDDTIIDFSTEIRNNYFRLLKSITLLSFITILFSISILIVYQQINIKACSFFMNQSVILFTALMVEIWLFVRCINPVTINIKGSIEKERIEEQYPEEDKKQENSTFITYYSMLENLIKLYAAELTQINNLSSNELKFYDALNILRENGIFNNRICQSISELRKYRNALLHSLENDKYVNARIYTTLQGVFDKVKNIYGNRSNQELKNQYIYELREYVEKTVFVNYSEIKILKLIQSNPDVTILKIAEELGIDRATASHKLNELQDEGKILRAEDESGKKKWVVISDKNQ